MTIVSMYVHRRRNPHYYSDCLLSCIGSDDGNLPAENNQATTDDGHEISMSRLECKRLCFIYLFL